MKFKLIFGIFNAIVVFSFLFISLLPVLMLGWDYAAPFFQDSWYLIVVFLLILVGLDGYFIANWKLFTLLETEDWEKLQTMLEDDVYKKNKFPLQRLRILVSIYLRTGKGEAIVELGEYLLTNKPGIARKLDLQLAVGYLLQGNYERLVELFPVDPESSPLIRAGWGDWMWSFGKLKSGEQDAAAGRLAHIARNAKDDLVRVVSLYVLAEIGENTPSEDKISRFLSDTAESYSRATWARMIEKQGNSLHILALAAIIRDASDWLFSTEAVPEASTGPAPDQA